MLIYWRVTILKNISQWGWDYPIYEMENNFAMFETTKQKWSFSLDGMKIMGKCWENDVIGLVQGKILTGNHGFDHQKNDGVSCTMSLKAMQ
jgi:hypothetical protein